MADAKRTQLNFNSYVAPPSNSWNPAYLGSRLDSNHGNTYQQNQLLFNLDIASNPTNIAARFKHPGPFVIEKLGGAAREKESTPKVSPLKFSAVSEDRLSLAIQLAKRDLKNKLREDEQRKQVEAIEAAELKSQKGKKKIKKGQTLKSKSTKSSHGKILASRQLPIRERGDWQKQQSVQTQTPPKKGVLHVKRQDADAAQNGLLLLQRTPSDDKIDGEVRRRKRREDTMTPPSKESRVTESPVSRQTKEIKRLRLELKDYIGKIEQLSKQASQNPASNKRSKADTVDDEEEVKRKAVRKAEQASRSARLLYSLQQQVREIQEELERLGPGQIRHTKKSRAVNRLAAAHRGAVRALQAFVHHLPEHADADSGLPPLYQELGLLIRQLSGCCAQLEIGDNMGLPDGVLNILEQAKGLENVLEQQLKSPPRPTRSTNQLTSPRRRLAFEQRTTVAGHEKTSHGQQPPVQSGNTRVTFRDHGIFDTSPSKDLPVRDTDPYRTASTAPQERQRRDISMSMATPGSPERNAIMRAGLQALLRAETNRAVTPQGTAKVSREPAKNTTQPSQPMRMQSRKPTANRKQGRKQLGPSSRSLLLPAKLKADRERLQRNRVALKDAHFTVATKSSIAKQQPIKPPIADVPDRPTSTTPPPPVPKPAWTPPGTPRSFHKESTPRDKSADEESDLKSPRSPRSRSQISRVHFKDGVDGVRRIGGLNVEMTEKEIARQAWLDSEVSQRLNELDELRTAEMAKLQKLREDLERPSHWIDDTERAIRERLQPIISQAEELSTDHRRRTHMASQSVSRELSKRAIDKASSQADLLSDLILDDILEDTVKEMERMEQRADITKQVKQMQDAPTVEGLLQTLDIMEAEEEAIRRRWKKISYADSSADVNGTHVPQTHVETGGSVRDDWMTGTPLEGALLERLSGDIPHQHTSVTFTNKPQNGRSDSQQVNSHRKHTNTTQMQSANQPRPDDHTSRLHSGADNDIGERYLHARDTGEDYFHTKVTKGTHLLARDYSSTGERNYLQSRDVDSRTLEKPKFALFVPTESKKRIDQYRERFDRHLKRKSHTTIGTFDPWSMCNELADEILDDIFEQVTSQVGDIMSSCVDDIYEKEFDMNS